MADCGVKKKKVSVTYGEKSQQCKWEKFRKGMKKRFYTKIWPAIWDYMIVAVFGVLLIMVVDHPQLNYLSSNLRFLARYLYLDDTSPSVFNTFIISVITSAVCIISAVYIRQFTIRMLLFYKGWLYQPPRSFSLIVVIWGTLLRVLRFRNPKLYTYQRSLPRMRVPPLKSTIHKLLESVKPVLDDGEMANMREDASKFLTTLGPRVQLMLWLKSWWSPNYHTDWWEQYVYLMSRDPIAISSNYYIHDQINWTPTKRQVSRAAGITTIIMQFKALLDYEELEPLRIRNTIPLCMWQYERMFSTARIPRTDCDIIRHQQESEHIVVLAKGYYYKLPVNDGDGNPLNVLDWQIIYEWIANDAQNAVTEDETKARVASLTANNRTVWANFRREHFASGVNREFIQTVESAIILIVLDDHEFTTMSERVKYLLHGDGSSIWFDKSICAVFFTDGKFGFNGEHTWGDAPITAHLMEYCVTQEYLYRIYDDVEGYCKPYVSPDSRTSLLQSKSVIFPTRLDWELNTDLSKAINESYTFAVKNNNDLDFCLRKHDVFGKEFMKKSGNSPDAFIQMAIHLAYYKDSNGSVALTYESSMTRLFLQGRTETIRSLTQEVKDFVLAMNDVTATAPEKVCLMKIAGKKHQHISRDCMAGNGVDRHLFALYVVCRWQGYDVPFLKNALAMPWTLSTSQAPQFQTEHEFDSNMKEVKDALSPGGGFGPGCKNGYGVGYMIQNDSSICFHISSKRSCQTTDSERFMSNLFWALSEMKRVVGVASSS